MARKQATRTLSRIGEQLDACSTISFPVDDDWSGETVTRTFLVKRLWVVGSYARGALTCGDIDLVMELEDARWNDARPFKKLLLKSPQRVSLYMGTPQENTSRAVFADAHPVWERGQDWRALLEDIRPDANATRFPRLTDGLPFRLEQMAGSTLGWARAALVRRLSDELNWRFVPLEEVAAQAEKAAQSTDYQDLRDYAKRCQLGVKALKLLPYLHAFAEQFCEKQPNWKAEGLTWLRKGRTLFVMGTTPYLEALDEPGVSQIVTMPHLSIRGPNGFWVISRGREHPIVRTFAECEAWVVVDEKGELIRFVSSGPNEKTLFQPVDGIHIYRTEEDVLYAIEDDNACMPLEPGEARIPRRIRGEDFQEVLDSCFMLDGGLWWAVFSETGKRHAEWAGFGEDELTVYTLEELANEFRVSSNAGVASDAQGPALEDRQLACAA